MDVSWQLREEWSAVPSLREQFGQRLKSIRLQRKLTQEEFAELVGISLDMLSVIERGRHSPSFVKLEQIAERLDVSVASLFTFPKVLKRVPASASKRSAKK